MAHIDIHGTTDQHFAKLKDAFASSFADGLEYGGAVAVMLDGRMVVDLWAGHADKARVRPWQRDTLVNVWSSTKGVLATAVAMLVERGKLDYKKPIAGLWPEFAANGKDHISLDLVMSHRAGLNGLASPISLAEFYQWTPYIDALAAMAPNWEPGSRCAYHALSYGHLAGEPLRRASGKSVGRFIAEEIASPLGIDFHVGLPESEDHRVAELIEGKGASDWVADMLAGPYPHSVKNPTVIATEPNNRAFRAAEIPGANGHGNARSLATLYGDIVGGKSKLLSTAALVEASRPRFKGMDVSFNQPVTYGAGFRLEDDNYGNRASSQTIGHGGWGGTIAFGDPAAKLGFAYVTNTMRGFSDILDPRRESLVKAVYDCL